jgi:hypothetical protein
MFALSSETPLEGLARVNAACGIADACNVTEGIARIWLEIAHTLEELPQTSDAFDKGDISSDKVKTISKAAKPERMEKLAERESVSSRSSSLQSTTRKYLETCISSGREH